MHTHRAAKSCSGENCINRKQDLHRPLVSVVLDVPAAGA